MRKKMTRLESLGPALQQALAGIPPARKEVLYDVQERWPDLVGGDAGRRSFPEAIRGKTLLVAVSSAVWAQELSFQTHDLIGRLRKEIPYAGIEDLRFQVMPNRGD